MAFVERTDWVNSPKRPPKPGETPVRAADIKRWERGIAAAHEELEGRLSEEGIDERVRAVGDGTYATPSTVESAVTPKLDKTEAAATYATPGSVATQVPPLVAGAIAADPTVATQAATLAQSSAGLVHKSDPGIPSTTPAPGVLVAITDARGKQTFLTAVDTDGGPTDHSANLIGSRMTSARLPAQTKSDIAAAAGGLLGITKGSAENVLFPVVDRAGKLMWPSARESDGGPLDYWVQHLKVRLGLAFGAGSYIPEITGASPTRSLYVNEMVSGKRTLVTNVGDPRNALVVAPGVVVFDTDTGQKAWTVEAGLVEVLPQSGYVVGVGDSLTAHGGWLARVATLLSMTAVNLGVAGQTTTEIAFRQGGTVPLLTVSGNSIPATGPVTVTALNPTGAYRDSGGETTIPFTFDGTLAGVPGTLTENGQLTPATWTFTRTTGGSAIACPPGTPFYASQGVPQRSRLQVIWAGRNNTSKPDIAIRDLKAMVANLATAQKRYLVCSVTNGQAEPVGSVGYQRVATINDMLKAEYGTRFVDVRRYLIDNGLTDAGLTPTTDDTTAIAEDRIPPSLHSDPIHFTTAGYTAVGNCIAAAITSKGWN
ncbi:hypothetical protein C7T36_18490 [Rhodococcus sp. AD45-ID]|uniref:hypothetical protein n=1 Tax=unclassified Rhodococcus (in: high G+C Gram-positive bacteria) TaxID=192944 RepID=UPI0005D2E032|nr:MULTISPECIES: hypothetical protein [unclassified Rhodococcus (in: high G+C Gram-positive bacteria)]KJF21972.1 hypothetical protein SZ00_02616 [Rhodococcus sp. AD45]PSR39667.1 hypothetical protein C7T36_18490 [Rhodococcus sp. AD45-ID]